MKKPTALSLPPVSEQALRDPEETDDGECQRTPVDECGAPLVDEDGEEGPADGDGTCYVTFGRGECVGGGGGFEEEQSEEDEEFRPDSGGFDEGVYTEGLEGCKEDGDGCEAVVEGEREVDP